MFLWVSSTPLGRPVVPLEYGRNAKSSGLFGGASSKSISVSANSEKLMVPCGVVWVFLNKV